MRRITLHRVGDSSITIDTDLLDAEAFPATDLLLLYRKRWGIETLFYEVTQTLACAINTLAYPKTALLTFCLALVVANAVAVLKAAIRAAPGEEKADTLSNYYLK